ncbi:UDP-N-acetylmuramoyl-L-alanyl-D-glutamate--2,6-diaminopimelate ligase [Bacillus sp. 31A1R]|uniref:UDP-N-acetylmuramyl-tripeptide synthetase n=1 Tax=Robertmurraya mangrovi TaxID=3098077 RepID=A0ABU5IXI0_9BACI|nr:UDP-N-acetylmuramoyl-L-alanyl-D-glutamate--2,6-diaminopimelate ligase [Bacillus sp. 31A1R]MDZ5471863.1 UDP-N-acetylmuramoyl-L-alanyl-D-glutamate--2,6-diaminopimelate ligase [Bacillus sp. 31A1R]
MHLIKLLEAIEEINVNRDSTMIDIHITGIAVDSRKVEKGNLFIAISGYETDGHKYIEDAVKRGAVAVIGEHQTINTTVPLFIVKNSREALGKISSMFYNYPSKKHKVIGITGTNGKTTTSYLLKHILEAAGKSCSLIGTVSYIINGEVYKPTNTTPDALQIQTLLSKSEDEFFIMEISSHALKQSRIEGIGLDYGIFTNLSHDHLDYHETMEQYFEDKSIMFNHLKEDGKAIINEICPWGKRLAKKLHIPIRTLGSQSFEVHNEDNKKDGYHGCILKDIQLQGKVNFTLCMNGENYKIFYPFPGLHNIYNAAIAFLTAVEMGIEPMVVIKALASFRGAPGRFEIIHHPSGAIFVVDYAHTKDAFEHCLNSAKQQGAKRITHIFGFRGARDSSKRVDMVKTSAKHCDAVLLTLDDLNGVSENEISEELVNLNLYHCRGKGKVQLDRTLAIQQAWETAEEGDWVFITGKGLEEYDREFTLPARSDKEVILLLKENDKTEEKII